MISNCGLDENNQYNGGDAGDQTKNEYAAIDWYNRPWACVLRYPEKEAAEKIAEISRQAAENERIGYDQNQRLTYYEQLKATNWNPEAITKTCESDCSASTSANIIAAGNILNINKLKTINPSNTTSTLRKSLTAAGFELLTDKKYLTSDKYLLPGDILLYDGHHVAVNISKGSEVEDKYKIGWNHDKNGWWYADTETSYYKSCWKIINHHKYYFNPNGYAVKDWQEIAGKWYYFEPRDGHDLECALYKTKDSGVQEPAEF